MNKYEKLKRYRILIFMLIGTLLIMTILVSRYATTIEREREKQEQEYLTLKDDFDSLACGIGEQERQKLVKLGKRIRRE